MIDLNDSFAPVVRGWLLKTGALLVNLKLRYFVLNPLEGTFIRYAKKEHYPNKPIEIIPLKHMSQI
jgi:hypothetical protein